MESLIYMITPNEASVLGNGVLPLTTIARRLGRGVANNGNSVLLNMAGYYEISVSATFTAPVAGDVSIKVQAGGVDVAGATATTTITTASTETRSLAFSTIVRVLPCVGPVDITLINGETAINTTNISLSVKYLG